MAIIGYSPWQDAAEYGRGLGQSLGMILARLPIMRRQAELDERRLAVEEKRAEADAFYRRAMADAIPDKLAISDANAQAAAIRANAYNRSVSDTADNRITQNKLASDRNLERQRHNQASEEMQRGLLDLGKRKFSLSEAMAGIERAVRESQINMNNVRAGAIGENAITAREQARIGAANTYGEIPIPPSLTRDSLLPTNPTALPPALQPSTLPKAENFPIIPENDPDVYVIDKATGRKGWIKRSKMTSDFEPVGE